MAGDPSKTAAEEPSRMETRNGEGEEDAFQRCLSASSLQDVLYCREALLKREMELRLAEAAAAAAGVAISRVASSNSTAASRERGSSDDATADAVAVRVLLEEISSKLSRKASKLPRIPHDSDELSMEEILAIHVGAMDEDLDPRRWSLDTAKLSAAETVTTADETLSVLSSFSCSPLVESAKVRTDDMVEKRNIQEREARRSNEVAEEPNLDKDTPQGEAIGESKLQADVAESDEAADRSVLQAAVAESDKTEEESHRRADADEVLTTGDVGIRTDARQKPKDCLEGEQKDHSTMISPSTSSGQSRMTKPRDLRRSRSLSVPADRPNIIPEDETLELDQFLSRREASRHGGDDVSSVGSLSATRVGSVFSATSSFVEMTPLDEAPGVKNNLLELFRQELSDEGSVTKEMIRAWGLEDEEQFFLRITVTPSESVLEEKRLVDAAVAATQKMEESMAWLQDLQKAALEDGDVDAYAASLLPRKSEIRLPASDRLEPKVLPSPVRMVSSCPRRDAASECGPDGDDDTAWRTYWSEEHQREYYQDPKSGTVSWIAPASVSSKSRITVDNEDTSSTHSSITPSMMSRGSSIDRSYALSQHSLLQAAMCIQDEAEQQRKAKAKALYNVAKNLEKEKAKLRDRKPRDDATQEEEDDGETVVVSDFTRPKTPQNSPESDDDSDDDFSVGDISVKVQRYRKKLRRRRRKQPIRDVPVVVVWAVLLSVLHVVFKHGMGFDELLQTCASTEETEGASTNVEDEEEFEEVRSDDGDENKLEDSEEIETEESGEASAASGEESIAEDEEFEEVRSDDDHENNPDSAEKDSLFEEEIERSTDDEDAEFEEVRSDDGHENKLEADAEKDSLFAAPVEELEDVSATTVDDEEFEEVRSGDENRLDADEENDSPEEAFADPQDIADGMSVGDGSSQAIGVNPSKDTTEEGEDDDADEQTLAWIEKLRPKDDDEETKASFPLWTDEVQYEGTGKEDVVDLESLSFVGNDLLDIAKVNATFVNLVPSEDEEEKSLAMEKVQEDWFHPAGFDMPLSEFESKDRRWGSDM